MRQQTSFNRTVELSEPSLSQRSPAFPEPLHVGRPNTGLQNRFLKRVQVILDRQWYTNNGQFVQELEERLSSYLGVKHCIAMCNGTIALEITIRALKLTGEVIVPSFTFVASAHALQWQEITPVFCDIDPATHLIDPDSVERMITPRTTGIIGVHTWGRPCSVETLADIAERRNLTLLFDAAHAFGCSHDGTMIGNFGSAEVFSFHATKFFNTFEGGAVATNDDELAEKIRLMKNFGFKGYDNVDHIGTNGKMTEICAAMGLTGFESLDEFIGVNRENYSAYKAGLAGMPGIRLLDYEGQEKLNYQYITLEVEETAAGLTRDELCRLLQSENVLARRYFYPGCHRMEPYRSFFPHAGLLLPNTEFVAERVLVLPTGTSVGPSEIEIVCSIIRHAMEDPARVKERLAE
jgi:dTDP-4-amino-4,6-dideoxygalactose transaminase